MNEIGIEIDINKINNPMDLIKECLGKRIYVKCRYNRELKGRLHVNYFYIFKNLNIILYSYMMNI